jgi:hypothetical protein
VWQINAQKKERNLCSRCLEEENEEKRNVLLKKHSITNKELILSDETTLKYPNRRKPVKKRN